MKQDFRSAIFGTLLGKTLLYLFAVITTAFLAGAFLLIYFPSQDTEIGSHSASRIIFYAAFAGLCTSSVLAALFYYYIIVRIKKLEDILIYLRENEDAQVNFNIPGNDELNLLTLDIKKLLNVKRITEKALRESENLYKSVFDSSTDALLLTDSSNRIISHNKKFSELTGRNDEVISGSRFPFDFIDPSDYTFYQQFEEFASEGGVPGLEAILHDNQGKGLECLVSFSPVSIKDDTCYLIRVTDITESKNLEREKKERQLQLQQSDKLASLGLLVAGVAHEINNPNSFILFNIPFIEKSFKEIFQIIEQKVPDTSLLKIGTLPYPRFKSEMSDVIADMLEGAQRITKIIMDLKNIARAEPEGELEVFNLKETITGVLRLLTPPINKMHITPLVTVNDSTLLRGNRAKLSQVLINLITNSLEATGANGGYLYMSAEEGEEGYALEIRDTGSGITQENMQKIFEPFFTTKSSSGGTGLGLALSRTILQSLGWGIAVSSTPGSGTTVKILFPPEAIV